MEKEIKDPKVFVEVGLGMFGLENATQTDIPEEEKSKYNKK